MLITVEIGHPIQQLHHHLEERELEEVAKAAVKLSTIMRDGSQLEFEEPLRMFVIFCDNTIEINTTMTSMNSGTVLRMDNGM